MIQQGVFKQDFSLDDIGIIQPQKIPINAIVGRYPERIAFMAIASENLLDPYQLAKIVFLVHQATNYFREALIIQI